MQSGPNYEKMRLTDCIIIKIKNRANPWDCKRVFYEKRGYCSL